MKPCPSALQQSPQVAKGAHPVCPCFQHCARSACMHQTPGHERCPLPNSLRCALLAPASPPGTQAMACLLKRPQSLILWRTTPGSLAASKGPQHLAQAAACWRQVRGLSTLLKQLLLGGQLSNQRTHTWQLLVVAAPGGGDGASSSALASGCSAAESDARLGAGTMCLCVGHPALVYRFEACMHGMSSIR